MTKPFVIAGCGRSGTMGMARLLTSLRVRTSFEEFFSARVCGAGEAQFYPAWLTATTTAGEVSSLAAPYLKHVPEEVAILHQVRNPVAVIASLMGLQTWTLLRVYPNVKFNFRHVPELGVADKPIVLSMKYWLGWNGLVDAASPALRYRIEDIDAGLVRRILGTISADVTDKWIDQVLNGYESTFNRTQRTPEMAVSWRRIPGSPLKEQVLKRAIEYGYTEADLEAYCPFGPDCPHCGGAINPA
jgi:hypothetical protein